jgi:hypothetical protein
MDVRARLEQATCEVLDLDGVLGEPGRSLGTAWLVSDQGHLVTAGHIDDGQAGVGEGGRALPHDALPVRPAVPKRAGCRRPPGPTTVNSAPSAACGAEYPCTIRIYSVSERRGRELITGRVAYPHWNR